MPKELLYCTVRAKVSDSLLPGLFGECFNPTRYSGYVDFENKLCTVINQPDDSPDEFNLQIKMDDTTYFVMSIDFDFVTF
jgi:hypothetical protein